MPLIRIDVVEGQRSVEELRALADVVHEVLLAEFAAPDRDRYQVITEHKPGLMIIEDTGLGFERTDDVVLVQVFQQGRDTGQKQALYAGLARRLAEEASLRPQDLVVTIATNSPEDWSFGEGVAQFVEGQL